MSTILPANAMQTESSVSVRSVMVHLVWKELKLVIPAHLVIVCVAVVAILAIQMTSGPQSVFSFITDNPIVLWNMINILSAVVCASIFYGMDRENGSWAWQSSLPVSWQMSLATRLLTAAAIVVVIGTGGWMLVGGLLFDPPGQYDFGTSVLLGGIFWIQTYCVFAIALMLVSDVLWGLILAATLVVGIQMALPLPFEEGGGDLLALSSGGTGLEWWRIAILLSVQMLLMGVLALTHSWRWNHGCYSDVMGGLQKRFLGRSFLPKIAFPSLDVSASQSKSGPVRSLLWLSISQYFIVKLFITALFLFILVTVFSDSSNMRFGQFSENYFLGWFASLFLGISVFGGDQVRNRFAAVSGRGVSPEGFWLAKTLFPFLIAVLAGVVLVLPEYIRLRADMMTLASAYNGYMLSARAGFISTAMGFNLLLFMAALFCGLCFRSALMAMIVTVITGWLFAISIYLGLWVIPLEFGLEPLWPAFWMTAAASAGLVLASLWCCRRWFVLDRPRLMPIFVGVISVYLVLGFLFGAGSKYFAIPSATWQGGTVESVPDSIARLTDSKTDDQAIKSTGDFVQWPRLSSDATNLIDHHLQSVRQIHWESQPEKFRNQLRYVVGDLKLLTEDETSLVIHEIKQFVGELDKAVQENAARFPHNAGDDMRRDVELVNAACFCLDQELWPEATKLLEEMGRIRSNPVVKAQLGSSFRHRIYNAMDLPENLGTKQVMALGGPAVVRELLRPLFFQVDEAGVFATDMTTVLRYGQIEKMKFKTSAGEKGIQKFLGYNTQDSQPNWLEQQLSRRIAATVLKKVLGDLAQLHDYMASIRSTDGVLVGSDDMPSYFSQQMWSYCPQSDTSIIPSFLCEQAVTLATIWELQLSPMLDKLERELGEQAKE